jgi:polysaccharide biosynthesis/export protein
MNRTMRLAFTAFLAVGTASACSAQAGTQGSASSQASQRPAPTANPAGDDAHPELAHRNAPYQLKPDDVIALSFRFTPEFDQQVTVQPDGYISPKGLVQGIFVAGLSVPEMIDRLKTAYANVLNDPVITAVLIDFDRPFFVVGGAVKSPGRFDLRGTTTVTEGIAIAGGFDDYAKHSQVLLFRQYDEHWTEVKTLDLRRLLKGKSTEDLDLRAGDMLYVPKTAYAKFDKFLPRSSVGTYFQPLSF